MKKIIGAIQLFCATFMLPIQMYLHNIMEPVLVKIGYSNGQIFTLGLYAVILGVILFVLQVCCALDNLWIKPL